MLPPLTFRNPVCSASPAPPDPTACETLGDLDGRRVYHNVLDFFEMALVKLKCEDRANNLTAFDRRPQVTPGRKLHPIPGRVLGVLQWRGATLQRIRWDFAQIDEPCVWRRVVHEQRTPVSAIRARY